MQLWCEVNQTICEADGQIQNPFALATHKAWICACAGGRCSLLTKGLGLLGLGFLLAKFEAIISACFVPAFGKRAGPHIDKMESISQQRLAVEMENELNWLAT